MTKAVYTSLLVTLHHPIMLVNDHMSDEIYAPYNLLYMKLLLLLLLFMVSTWTLNT